MVSVTRTVQDCITDDQYMSNDIPLTMIRALYNECNEVYMVDRSGWLPVLNELWIASHNKLFFCIRGNADAGVISTRYGDILRRPDIPLVEGSVDVLIHSRRQLGNKDIPDDVRFNTCFKPGSAKRSDNDFRNYWLMVHEAGHALGLSEFSHLGPISWKVAHPMVLDSAMNYDRETKVPEPDCSPHPLDIMAIFALYRTLDP